MSELRYLTAGESHGPGLTAIVEGMPAGVPVTEEAVNRDLARRQKGYGRGPRMTQIESDQVRITSGVRWGETLGSPIALTIANKDWEKWEKKMSLLAQDRDPSGRVLKPRPGHADLVGVLKYDRSDIQDILERASARETAARAAVGAVAKALLDPLGIQVFSYVREIGAVAARDIPADWKELREKTEASPVRCPDAAATERMKADIDAAQQAGDTRGGVFTVLVKGCPPGLGSHVHWDRKLEARLGWVLLSIQAIKGVEIGMGFDTGRRPGSEVHDELFHDPARGFHRRTNHAGGFEGGMTTGEMVVLSAVMKPLSSLRKPLRSVHLETKEAFKAEVIRSDVTAVPSAAVAAEGVVAFEIAQALREKFGGDSLREMKDQLDRYVTHLKTR